ncbi:MAG: glycolate oxidase subunit GlcF, partial [Woeseia sp.]
CGICNATCPTYQITGNELDGPRGRIYLIKGVLETGVADKTATTHLDRCLTCRACETACPSGVDYGELLEIAREDIGPGGGRSVFHRLMRMWFRHVLPNPARLRRWTALGRLVRWLLPKHFRAALPERDVRKPGAGRRGIAAKGAAVVVLEGCVQSASTPATTRALRHLLERNGRRGVVVQNEVCCGSLDLHLGETDTARDYARRNIDALEPLLADAEAILSSASGCGVTVKDYPRLLAGDPYAERASAVAARVRDAAEYCASLEFRAGTGYRRVAWHSPCTLQHGQKINGVVEELLARAGYELTDVADAQSCCGSAGTYSYLHRAMAEDLRRMKIDGLTVGSPDVIATANVGCQLHLRQKSPVPVVHWLELV